ncbi:MAG: magnesium transporter [Gemmatimonadota bacterium]
MTDFQSEAFSASELLDAWPVLDTEERVAAFQELSPQQARDFLPALTVADVHAILVAMAPSERPNWLRRLAPDDVVDVLQRASEADRAELLGQLDPPTLHEVRALLAYAEDDAGGIMSPRVAGLRPEMTADEAIRYLRRQAAGQQVETIYYAYVVDPTRHLLGVVSFRQLVAAPPDRLVRDLMKTDLVSVLPDRDQEQVAHLLADRGLLAVPVVDAENRLQGIITVDDLVDVLRAEATEDFQKLGGTQALDTPYLQVGFWSMIRKRAVWLAVLFVGEMLTASAMSYYEVEISRAVVLALFVPLIISSGGNSGSQASTLVIRAMALGEVRLREWWLVARRELGTGLALGTILAGLGLARIAGWEFLFGEYGAHWARVALTVGVSLIGVVTWGTVVGSSLPFLLRRLGLDPASASAPFVATLVDVVGLIIYFTVAASVMPGAQP